LYRTEGIHTVSIDAQTGIQALERIATDLLPQSGMIARRGDRQLKPAFQRILSTLHC
jgi:hypothetical protein